VAAPEPAAVPLGHTLNAAGHVVRKPSGRWKQMQQQQRQRQRTVGVGAGDALSTLESSVKQIMLDHGSSRSPGSSVPSHKLMLLQDAQRVAREALDFIDANKTEAALEAFDRAVFALQTLDASDGKIRRLLADCVRYAVVLHAYTELRQLEIMAAAQAGGGLGDSLAAISRRVKQNERLARLAAIITSHPLRPKHRVRFIKAAIRVNIALGNFKTAERHLSFCLRFAGEKAKADIATNIAMCKERGLDDAMEGVWLCPETWRGELCGGAVDTLTGGCPKCSRTDRLCAESFAPVASTEALRCQRCQLAFAASRSRYQGLACPCCHAGKLGSQWAHRQQKAQGGRARLDTGFSVADGGNDDDDFSEAQMDEALEMFGGDEDKAIEYLSSEFGPAPPPALARAARARAPPTAAAVEQMDRSELELEAALHDVPLPPLFASQSKSPHARTRERSMAKLRAAVRIAHQADYGP